MDYSCRRSCERANRIARAAPRAANLFGLISDCRKGDSQSFCADVFILLRLPDESPRAGSVARSNASRLRCADARRNSFRISLSNGSQWNRLVFRFDSVASRGIGDLWSDFIRRKRTNARNRDPSRAWGKGGNILHIVLRQGLVLAIAGAAVGLIFLCVVVSQLIGQLALWSSAHRSVAGVALLFYSAWLWLLLCSSPPGNESGSDGCPPLRVALT